MKKILVYVFLVIICIEMVVLFVTATSYTQLATATLLYPLLTYVVITLFPRKYRIIHDTAQPVSIQPIDISEKEKLDIADIDRRTFLKLVGATGFSFFLFSIFTKKAENLFLGRVNDQGTTSLQNPAGNKIYPSEQQPTDGYEITEVDDGEFTFCGYTNKNGNWFIMKGDIDSGSFRYAKGETDFPGNWANRENLTYDYFFKVFSQQ